MGSRKNKGIKISDNVVVEDRISQLPDHVRSEILSHLASRDAVRTSALSSRWTSLWKSVPELNLNSRIFWDVNRFISFAEKYFDPRMESEIRKFRLDMYNYNSPDDQSFINRWIDAVTARKIQHLDLTFCVLHDSPPLNIYFCHTLVNLRLCKANLVDAEVVSLPCLKIIRLDSTTCPNEATLLKLISSSPVLEDLTLINTSSSITKVLQVRSPTLKRIYVKESEKVVIDAPLLQFFSTYLFSTKNVEIINLGFSTKLDINLVHGHELYISSFIDGILTDISKVRELVISHAFWKDILLNSRLRPVPQFCYLSLLNTRFFISHFEMLPTVLESCPVLETFILELVKDSSMHGKRKIEPKLIFSTVPQCVSTLKLVELRRSIKGNEGEIQLLRYLLKNSTILEKVKLYVYYSKSTECDFLKKILTMTRCSSACEIHCSIIPKRNREYDF